MINFNFNFILHPKTGSREDSLKGGKIGILNVTDNPATSHRAKSDQLISLVHSWSIEGVRRLFPLQFFFLSFSYLI